MENGFKAMSKSVDERGGTASDESTEGQTADRLKAYGVDTDVMAEAATERVSELQQLIMDEVRARPLRALGWAAAAGVVFGFWAAK
ncbi:MULTISPECIES: hypothetical protein [unclassified Bosea (in: a-proteobacteria)]|uniref:hypothetical protein n=1 Tax=unclassified Bosea (in: a-proteobacteria) TaxID=2653178 RepID=UPI000F761320|nr:MULTISPECIES: hypothetical protein [unclassified Bosea (in: a-proteobacteria)]AZO82009.1 hypothetical protein BLM15_29895 [Bosea sp. Tri-49]MCV9937393.1 hypothetical protein [Boseaceae bacterium BT-24-1]RXT16671.1 hypothetical protein B5U98_27480 [Bosea sp. Tri-39]RXT42408.1 hypothetical protein B5U99_00440 [Bosea sp. Tri-54]